MKRWMSPYPRPATGTWKEQDSAGYVNGLSLQRFVSNNPMTLVDPSGACQCGENITARLLQLRDDLWKEWHQAATLYLGQTRSGPTRQGNISFNGLQNWDIYQLAWQKSLFHGTGPCEGTVTVTINGQPHCFNAEQVNYYLYGLAYRMKEEAAFLNKYFGGMQTNIGIISLAQGYLNQIVPSVQAKMEDTIYAYRFYLHQFNGWHFFNTGEAKGREDWADAGLYNDLALALPSERKDCEPCTTPYAGPFGGYIGEIGGGLLGWLDDYVNPNNSSISSGKIDGKHDPDPPNDGGLMGGDF
jgi:hypothetical protein